jgi:surface antigen
MAKFVQQTSAPSTTDKNYIHYTEGGYNYCIEIKNGSCLPNCTGYAWGRWRCLLGKFHNLSRRNAENWWGNTKDGYKRGQIPKLGAVVCWKKGQVEKESDGAGHVGIVEKITLDSVVVSMSAWGGTRWFTRTFKKGSYSYNCYVFQGFIYLPIEFEEAKPSYKTGDYEVTCDLLNVRAGAGTDFAKKTFSQLTPNAQKQIKDLNNGRMANGYVEGVQCTVSQVKNNWGKTPSGWICLDYCKKI